MQKGKLFPLIVIGVLTILSICLFLSNINKNKHFSRLIVVYKNQTLEYKTLTADSVIVIDEISFWVVSKEKKSIVLKPNKALKVEGLKVNEIKIKLGEEKTICDEDRCILMRLK